MLIALCAYLIASLLLDMTLEALDTEFNFTFNRHYLSANIWRGVYFASWGSMIYLSVNRNALLLNEIELRKKAEHIQEENNRLALNLSNAKMAYLKAQINPHFMLSTLSYIRDSVLLEQPKIADAILYLSEVVKYAISNEHSSGKVSLSTEIKQANNLLSIIEITEEKIFIDFNVGDGLEKIQIIPFLLPSLVENMIKHGNLVRQSFPASIKISANSDNLVIKTKNLKSTGLNDSGYHSGLPTIEKRLSENYGQAASISYGLNDDGYFLTRTIIPLEYNLEKF